MGGRRFLSEVRNAPSTIAAPLASVAPLPRCPAQGAVVEGALLNIDVLALLTAESFRGRYDRTKQNKPSPVTATNCAGLNG